MTQKIKDKNKLIAEFMGLPRYTGDTYSFKRFKNLKVHLMSIKQMKFNKDWNWLMLVVKKINEVETKKCNWSRRYVIHQTLHKADIKFTFFAVVEFIKWYNQQPLPQPPKQSTKKRGGCNP